MINVRNLGARGDGATDDTLALQAALNLVTARDSVVYVPAGDYRITTTLQPLAGTTIAGDGRYVSTVRAAAGASADLNLWTLTAKNDVTFRDLGFYGTARAYTSDPNRVYGNGIRSGGPTDATAGCENLTIERCYFQKCANALMDDNGTNVRFDDSHVFMDFAGFTAVQLRGTIRWEVTRNYLLCTAAYALGPINAIWCYAGNVIANDLLIQGNRIVGFNGTGFETVNVAATNFVIADNDIDCIARGTGAGASNDHRAIDVFADLNHATRHAVIANNTIRNVTTGIRVASIATAGVTLPYVQVRGNMITTVMQGIKVEGTGAATAPAFVRVTENTIIDADDLGDASAQLGVGLAVSETSDCAYANNTIEDCTKDGIWVTATVTRAHIAGNSISGCAQHGIHLSSVANNCTVRDNKVHSITSIGIRAAGGTDTVFFGNHLSSCGTPMSIAGTRMGVWANPGQPTFTAVAATPYAVLATDSFILVDSTVNTMQINLPTAANRHPNAPLVVKRIAGGNNVNINPVGAELLEGVNAAIALTANYQDKRIASDAVSSWWADAGL